MFSPWSGLPSASRNVRGYFAPASTRPELALGSLPHRVQVHGRESPQMGLASAREVDLGVHPGCGLIGQVEAGELQLQQAVPVAVIGGHLQSFLAAPWR